MGNPFNKLNLSQYKGVSCNIGMFQVSLAENGVNFDFGSGDVDFWEFAQALKKNIDMNIAEGNHLVYHRKGSTVEEILALLHTYRYESNGM